VNVILQVTCIHHRDNGKLREIPSEGGEFRRFLKDTFFVDYVDQKTNAAPRANLASYDDILTKAAFERMLDIAKLRLATVPQSRVAQTHSLNL